MINKILIAIFFSQVYKLLVEKTSSTPGANVENNKFCVSVHFRCVDEKVISCQFFYFLFSINKMV